MELLIDSRRLKPRSCRTHFPWRIWGKKSFNMHRGVIEWNLPAPCPTIEEVTEQIRSGIREEFKPNWIRGFGFGVILHFPSFPADFASLPARVDRRNRAGGVWQWVIACFESEKTAIAFHTWQPGYLRPAYDELLGQLARCDYQCAALDTEKDKLIAALEEFSKAIRSLTPTGLALRILTNK
jgi:hypothetical protein